MSMYEDVQFQLELGSQLFHFINIQAFLSYGPFLECDFIQLYMGFHALNIVHAKYLLFVLHQSCGIPSSKINRGVKDKSICRIFMISTFTSYQTVDIIRQSQNICVWSMNCDKFSRGYIFMNHSSQRHTANISRRACASRRPHHLKRLGFIAIITSPLLRLHTNSTKTAFAFSRLFRFSSKLFLFLWLQGSARVIFMVLPVI